MAKVSGITDGQVIDSESGEVLDFSGSTVVDIPDRRKPISPKAGLFHKRWGLADFGRLSKLPITAAQWRLLMIIADMQDKESEEVRMSPQEMARRARAPYNSTLHALAALVDAGAVIRLDRGIYRVHPYYCYRGGADAWELLTRVVQQAEIDERMGMKPPHPHGERFQQQGMGRRTFSVSDYVHEPTTMSAFARYVENFLNQNALDAEGVWFLRGYGYANLPKKEVDKCINSVAEKRGYQIDPKLFEIYPGIE